VVLEQYLLVAVGCTCVLFYQGIYSCGFSSVRGTRSVAMWY
jgi:hypothetical protein